MKKDICYLLSYEVNGIKNLDKDVKLEFYKKTIDKNFNPSEYNIKAIYGENGTGKSAIVTSVKVLKNLMLNRYYLIDQKNEIFLNELINKKQKRAYYNVEYLNKINEHIFLFNYYLEIKLDEIDNYYKIEKEKLSYKTLSSKKWTDAYLIEKGKLVDSSNNKLFEKLNKENGTETLRQETFMSYFSYKSTKKEIDEYELLNDKDNKMFACSIMCNMNFAIDLYIYMDEENKPDKHINEMIANENILEPNEDNNKLLKSVRNVFNDNVLSHRFAIHKDDINKLKESILKVYEFINIFKPELKNIEVDKKEYYEFYICDLIFNYGDYKVNAAYESNGIKKLIRLFKAIEAVDKGRIVFIDEFDSNIHDVYLCKLIEYIGEYAKGQLCFTTQSITVMDVLENRKKSLDFLARDKTITSWFKNSHYAASKLYKKGFIEKSPFNIESFDFLRAFGESIDEL